MCGTMRISNKQVFKLLRKLDHEIPTLDPIEDENFFYLNLGSRECIEQSLIFSSFYGCFRSP